MPSSNGRQARVSAGSESSRLLDLTKFSGKTSLINTWMQGRLTVCFAGQLTQFKRLSAGADQTVCSHPILEFFSGIAEPHGANFCCHKPSGSSSCPIGLFVTHDERHCD